MRRRAQRHQPAFSRRIRALEVARRGLLNRTALPVRLARHRANSSCQRRGRDVVDRMAEARRVRGREPFDGVRLINHHLPSPSTCSPDSSLPGAADDAIQLRFVVNPLSSKCGSISAPDGEHPGEHAAHLQAGTVWIGRQFISHVESARTVGRERFLPVVSALAEHASSRLPLPLLLLCSQPS